MAARADVLASLPRRLHNPLSTVMTSGDRQGAGGEDHQNALSSAGALPPFGGAGNTGWARGPRGPSSTCARLQTGLQARKLWLGLLPQGPSVPEHFVTPLGSSFGQENNLA